MVSGEEGKEQIHAARYTSVNATVAIHHYASVFVHWCSFDTSGGIILTQQIRIH